MATGDVIKNHSQKYLTWFLRAEPPEPIGEPMAKKRRIRGIKRVTYASNLPALERYQATERQRRTEVRDRIAALKQDPCEDCGEIFDPVCMDFDHRPSEKKLAQISQMVWMPWARILEEIAKCDLVCANCHRLRTHERRQS